MIRLVVYLLILLAAAVGLGWLADNPGTMRVEWLGQKVEMSIFTATIALAALVAALLLVIAIVRGILNAPAALGARVVRQRQQRGLEALSSGMIAVGAGDKALATHYALQARKSLPHEPLTHLLRAQAAQLAGDRSTARRIFESMLSAPDTEQLGLRGLFLEARHEGAEEAARQFADRAAKANPKLGWSSDALFELQCKQKDWAAALDTLGQAKRNGLVDKTVSERRRAVLLAGQAQDAEDADANKALLLAQEAHTLAPDLVPAAAVAARILAARGQTGKAAKIIQRTWVRAPHPDLATACAFARIGDSPRDRLDRVRQLAALNPHSIESPIAVATTAIEARLFGEAREALQPLLEKRLTQRIATLMARVEAGENDDKGRVREWLARAVNAARDPVWTADGVIADRWEPVSPVTGAIDAFQWRVPVESLDAGSANILGERLEELLAVSAPPPPASRPAPEPSPAVIAEVREPPPRAPVRAAEPEIIDAEAVTVRTVPAARPARLTAAPPAPAVALPDVSGAGDATVSGADTAAATSKIPKPEGAAEPSQINKAGEQADAKGAEVSSALPSASRAQRLGAEASRSARPGMKPASEPKIFVAPRAPDDPGPEEGEIAQEEPYPKRPFRAAK